VEFALFALLALYLAPALLAAGRNHPQQSGVLLFNVLLGWTLLGWLAALVWAAPPLGSFARSRRPALYLVRDPPTPGAPGAARARLRGSVAPPLFLPLVAGGLAVTVALASGDSLRRLPIESPFRTELLRADATTLRARPGARSRAVGELHAPCRVKVLEENGRWQRIWKTARCGDRSSGSSTGWIRTFASLPPH